MKSLLKIHEEAEMSRLTQRYGLPAAAIDDNMQKLVALKGAFKPPRALTPEARPKRPERGRKRQLGSRLPATPQHPLRQAFCKGKVLEEDGASAKRRRLAVERLQRGYGCGPRALLGAK